MMQSVSKFTNKYHVMVRDVDFTKKLKLSAAFNYLEEIAGLHAENLGIGFDAMREKYNAVWVLARIRLDIERYPEWEEEVVVETWPQPPKRFEFYRDYLIKDMQGHIIARGISMWTTLNMNTHQLVKTDALSINFPDLITDRALDCSLSKIRPSDEMKPVYKRAIGCSDIDMNGHLNNSKYIDFVTDCFSMEDLKKYRADSIQANYLDEAFPGDVIVLSKSAGTSGDGFVYIEGTNEKDGSKIFSARLHVVEIK
jgi:Acyl-ACP thioesterase